MFWPWFLYFIQEQNKLLVIELYVSVSLVRVVASGVLCQELADFLASRLDSVFLSRIRCQRELRLIHAGSSETDSRQIAVAPEYPTFIPSKSSLNRKRAQSFFPLYSVWIHTDVVLVEFEFSHCLLHLLSATIRYL